MAEKCYSTGRSASQPHKKYCSLEVMNNTDEQQKYIQEIQKNRMSLFIDNFRRVKKYMVTESSSILFGGKDCKEVDLGN